MRDDRWYGRATRSRWHWLLTLFVSFFVAIAADAATNAQCSFATPDDAVQALVQAIKSNDRAATLAVLGQDASEWISSGDAAADRVSVAGFVAAYDAKHEIVRDGNKATLTLGEDDFPFAFPIIRNGERWRFDTAAGKGEMLARRIGENELNAIKVLQAISDAQIEYASEDRNGDGVLAYAQKFASSPGKHDGLYWPVKQGEAMSPLGPFVAQAASEGYRVKEKGPTPYHGYYYRMLKSQGEHAASGAQDYVVNGRAIGGFAAIAYPARYGSSGVMSFMINHDGSIYQADLGPNTQARARKMQRFDPGAEWALVQLR